jgi:hypothetical protein
VLGAGPTSHSSQERDCDSQGILGTSRRVRANKAALDAKKEFQRAPAPKDRPAARRMAEAKWRFEIFKNVDVETHTKWRPRQCLLLRMADNTADMGKSTRPRADFGDLIRRSQARRRSASYVFLCTYLLIAAQRPSRLIVPEGA